MTLHIIRWHMAYFLCNFQDFPLLWTASAFSIVSMVSLQFFSVSFALAASAKNAEKVVISRFPSDLSTSLIKADGTWLIFLANFIFFPLLWTASAKPSFLSLGFLGRKASSL